MPLAAGRGPGGFPEGCPDMMTVSEDDDVHAGDIVPMSYRVYLISISWSLFQSREGHVFSG